MPPVEYCVLAINPGSTSTKIGLFRGEKAERLAALRHTDGELAPFAGQPVLAQRPFRAAQIEAQLAQWGIGRISAVVGRGGLLRPLPSGTYRINDAMLDELVRAKRGDHASNLGAFLAADLAVRAGCAAYVVDPVSVDEWPQRARFSGTSLFERQCLSHALNTKAAAKRYARASGQAYSALRLVVAHLGSGISVSAHEKGRMIDVTNSREEGAFSSERAGGVPASQLLKLCFSGRYSQDRLDDLLNREGGLASYLGTKDLGEVERRIRAGDRLAESVFEAMVYQIAKEIGAMAAALCGRVDALIITGGMAHSERLLESLSAQVRWIAPLAVYPGEDELPAMVQGVLRVLRGEETVCELSKDDETPQATETAGTATSGERR